MQTSISVSLKPIILCGFMNSGKTTIGAPLARQLGYGFTDTDQLLVLHSKMTISEMFKKGGEPYFRDQEHEIAKKVCHMEKSVISTGGGMLTFERNSRLLSEHGIIVYIHKEFEECYNRLICQPGRPIAAGKSKAEMQEMYESRIPLYQKYAAVTLINNGTVNDAVEYIISKLCLLSGAI